VTGPGQFMLKHLQKSIRQSVQVYFHVSISIGTPESDSLSLSTPRKTKRTLVYCINALQHRSVGLLVLRPV